MPTEGILTVRCSCGKKLKAPADSVGKKARCPACGSVMRLLPMDDAPLFPLTRKSAQRKSPPPQRQEPRHPSKPVPDPQ